MGFCPKMHAFRGRLGCNFSRLEAFGFAGFIGFGVSIFDALRR
jgi:hypothetical protein